MGYRQEAVALNFNRRCARALIHTLFTFSPIFLAWDSEKLLTKLILRYQCFSARKTVISFSLETSQLWQSALTCKHFSPFLPVSPAWIYVHSLLLENKGNSWSLLAIILIFFGTKTSIVLKMEIFKEPSESALKWTIPKVRVFTHLSPLYFLALFFLLTFCTFYTTLPHLLPPWSHARALHRAQLTPPGIDHSIQVLK